MTMYPVCTPVPQYPRCEKAARNIGLLRVAMFVVCPFAFALLLSVILHSCVDRQRRRWYAAKQAAKARDDAALIAMRADPNASVQEENKAAEAIQARIRGE